jgi:transposase
LSLSAQSIPQPDPTLSEIIAQLQEKLTRKDQALVLAEMKIKVLEERLRLDRIARYGKRSETLSDLQLQLLDLEPGVSSEEIEAESDREPLKPPPAQDNTSSKPRRKHPGRQELPSHLARIEQIVVCTPEQCNCGKCGKQTTVIGYEETEVLDVRPVEYFVRVIKREKRACSSCEEQGVRTAPVPERIVAKSVLSDQMIIEAIVDKYCASLPLYRQQAIIKRDAGVQIALSTLNDGVLRVGELLIPIAAAMKREVLAGTYIQADETPIGVQTHDKRGRNHQAYMWQYGSPGKTGAPTDRSSSVGCGGVVFDFRMGREGEGPKLFLGNFNGLLQTDGYKGYNHVGGPKMVHACCLAHARRKFVDAVKVNAKDQESAQIVGLMDELFAIDRKAREQNLDRAQRDVLRQEQAPELLDKLRQAVLALKKTALPKSAAGQAANYTLSFWSKLTVFLKYPELELSTNLAENAMRPIAIGRKNWLHLGSKEAGPKIAAIFSVVESCRRLNVPIRRYLGDVLPGLANRSIQSLAELTPTAYAARMPN